MKTCNHSQNIRDKLQFSYETVHYRKFSISIFQNIFVSADKIFISGSELSTRQQFYQRGLNKKETQLLLTKYFLSFSRIRFIRLMTLNGLNLGREVTFMKYFASVVSLIFLLKILTWNKITFLASNFLNIAELVGNELIKSIYEKFYQYFFFYPIYRYLL